MNFTTAVKTCFAKYLDWNGRALRSEFWWWMLFSLFASLTLGVVDSAVFGTSFEDTGVPELLFTLGTMLPSLFVGTRRLHDVGRSGWWQLISITIIGILLLLYWWIIEGNQGDNDYGPHPLSDNSDNLSDVFR